MLYVKVLQKSMEGLVVERLLGILATVLSKQLRAPVLLKVYVVVRSWWGFCSPASAM